MVTHEFQIFFFQPIFLLLIIFFFIAFDALILDISSFHFLQKQFHKNEILFVKKKTP